MLLDGFRFGPHASVDFLRLCAWVSRDFCLSAKVGTAGASSSALQQGLCSRCYATSCRSFTLMVHPALMVWRSSAFRWCFAVPEASSLLHIFTGCISSLTSYLPPSFVLSVDMLLSESEPCSQVVDTKMTESMKQWANQITGANAGGPRLLPIRTRWVARIAQFQR